MYFFTPNEYHFSVPADGAVGVTAVTSCPRSRKRAAWDSVRSSGARPPWEAAGVHGGTEGEGDTGRPQVRQLRQD